MPRPLLMTAPRSLWARTDVHSRPAVPSRPAAAVAQCGAHGLTRRRRRAATHVCCRDVTIELPHGITRTVPCNALFKLYIQEGRYNTGQAVVHAMKFHPESTAGTEGAAREASKTDQQHSALDSMATASARSKRKSLGGILPFAKRSADTPATTNAHRMKINAAIARWVIHSKQMVPQRTLSDPFFKVRRTPPFRHCSPFLSPRINRASFESQQETPTFPR